MAAPNSTAAPGERQVSETYTKFFQGTLKPQFVSARNGEKEGNEGLKKLARNPFKKTPEDVETPETTVSELEAPVSHPFVAELATVMHEHLDHDMPDAPSGPLGVDDVDDVIMEDAPPLSPVTPLDVAELDSAEVVEDTVMEDAPPLSPETSLDVAELDSTEVVINIEDPDTVMEDAPPLSPAQE